MRNRRPSFSYCLIQPLLYQVFTTGWAFIAVHNLGQQFAAVIGAKAVAKERAQHIRPADAAAAGDNPIKQVLQGHRAFENQIVAVFNL